jgi:hypothetical protein
MKKEYVDYGTRKNGQGFFIENRGPITVRLAFEIASDSIYSKRYGFTEKALEQMAKLILRING